jgi:hypothetical protein
VLRLKTNSITLLERESFVSRGLTELVVLNVDSFGLRTVGLGAFNGPKI